MGYIMTRMRAKLCGYDWTVTHDDGTVAEYSTDNYGYGLWKDGVQVLGTAQFALAGFTGGTRRAKAHKVVEDSTVRTLPMVDKRWDTRVPVALL